MAFQPRVYETILTDGLNYVRANTDLTDAEVGSVIRTILEATALEDDEQYFQMVQLLDAFNLQNATGTLLQGRLQDYNIQKLGPVAASVKVVILDNNLITNALAFDSTTSSTTITLTNSSAFPSSGTVRIGEGTIAVEDIAYSANNTTTNVLTLSTTPLNAHAAGDRVSIVTGASDRVIASAQQVQVGAVGNSAPTKYITTATTTIVNGNYESVPVSAAATVPGTAGNVGPDQIGQFSSSPPFTGAGVYNPSKAGGGRDQETDAQVKDRARGQLQSLSRGTKLALQQAALGVTDPVTGQSVVSSSVLENYFLDEVSVFIDDGTGFTPDTTPAPIAALAANPSPNPGAASLTLTNSSTFPQTGSLIVSPEDSSQLELVGYTAVNYTTSVVTLAAPTANVHNIGDQVILGDVLATSTEAGTDQLQTRDFPIVRDSMRIWVNNGAGLTLIPSNSYYVDRAVGKIQFFTPLITGSTVVAAYTAYAGLVQTVQQVISGALSDPVNFPGYASEGVLVVVETPTIRRISVRAAITAAAGYVETNLAPQVQEAIQTYISGLQIGQNVIVAEIIATAMAIAGVANIAVPIPSSDVTVLPNELPVPYDSLGNSLVTVS